MIHTSSSGLGIRATALSANSWPVVNYQVFANDRAYLGFFPDGFCSFVEFIGINGDIRSP